MNSFENKILLMKSIQRRPCLYDKSHKLYKNSLYKQKLWQQISAETIKIPRKS